MLNLDDPGAPALLQALDNAVPVVTYGINAKDANVVAESIKSNIWETEVGQQATFSIWKTAAGLSKRVTRAAAAHASTPYPCIARTARHHEPCNEDTLI